SELFLLVVERDLHARCVHHRRHVRTVWSRLRLADGVPTGSPVVVLVWCSRARAAARAFRAQNLFGSGGFASGCSGHRRLPVGSRASTQQLAARAARARRGSHGRDGLRAGLAARGTRRSRDLEEGRPPTSYFVTGAGSSSSSATAISDACNEPATLGSASRKTTAYSRPNAVSRCSGLGARLLHFAG